MSTTTSLLLNKILNDALERKATDIHLTVGNYPVYRINGQLVTATQDQILTPDVLNTVAESFLSPAENEALQRQREVATVYTWADRARFRAQVFYQRGYMSLSLRVIPPRLLLPKELQISPMLIAAMAKTKGLIFISGPYNSGRSTTAASLVEYVNQTQSRHILTLEQPIEYQLVNNKSVIHQRQVGTDVPSFIDGLHEAVDADVDVIVVAHVNEAAEEVAILQAVEGGKLVLVVLNGLSISTTLESFMGLIPPSEQQWAKDIISEHLLIMTNQRLVPKSDNSLQLVSGILTMNGAVRNVLRDGNFFQLSNVMMTSRQDGMITLDRSLADLVKAGILSLDQASKYAVDPNGLQLMVKQ